MDVNCFLHVRQIKIFFFFLILSYEYDTGRQSALELMAYIFLKFPQVLYQNQLKGQREGGKWSRNAIHPKCSCNAKPFQQN